LTQPEVILPLKNGSRSVKPGKLCGPRLFGVGKIHLPFRLRTQRKKKAREKYEKIY
jgi:hypothetical protein